MVILASGSRLCRVLILHVARRPCRLPKLLSTSHYLSSKMPFYAVAKGVVPGIYTEWSECQKQVQGFRGPQFKKFATREEAEDFIAQRNGGVVDKRASKNGSNSSSSVEQPTKKRKTDDGSAVPHLPPELLAIQKEIKRQQQDLLQLQHRFDEYVAAAASQGKSNSGPAQDKGKKRARSSDTEDSDDVDAASGDGKGATKERSDDAASGGGESAIKKRVLARPVPDKENFQVDEDGNVIVYTDGCCEMNGRNGARAGVGVYFGPENPMNISEPVRGRATNNTAEIQAITYALELIKRAGFDRAVINTDSQFVINCMTSWMSGWKKRGWKKSDGTTVINKEDLIDLDRATEGLMVKYNHVKGHSGVHGNEVADQLAKEGSKSYDASVTE